MSVIWGNRNGRQSENTRSRQVVERPFQPKRREVMNGSNGTSDLMINCVCECSCVYFCVHARIQDVSSRLLPCFRQGLLLFTMVYAKVTCQQTSEDSPSYLVMGELGLQTCITKSFKESTHICLFCVCTCVRACHGL